MSAAVGEYVKVIKAGEWDFGNLFENEITGPLKSSAEVFQAKDRKLSVTFTSVLQMIKLL